MAEKTQAGKNYEANIYRAIAALGITPAEYMNINAVDLPQFRPEVRAEHNRICDEAAVQYAADCANGLGG